jgi:hypothetical protein
MDACPRCGGNIDIGVRPDYYLEGGYEGQDFVSMAPDYCPHCGVHIETAKKFEARAIQRGIPPEALKSDPMLIIDEAGMVFGDMNQNCVKDLEKAYKDINKMMMEMTTSKAQELVHKAKKYDAIMQSIEFEAQTHGVRPALIRFVNDMERKLSENDKKGDWGDCDVSYLMTRLFEEVRELQSALLAWDRHEGGCLPMVVSECADVANFAMMVRDVVEKLSVERAAKILKNTPSECESR